MNDLAMVLFQPLGGSSVEEPISFIAANVQVPNPIVVSSLLRMNPIDQ